MQLKKNLNINLRLYNILSYNKIQSSEHPFIIETSKPDEAFLIIDETFIYDYSL